jgi:hypothetical protein
MPPGTYMNRPVAVRIGILLLSLALIIRAATLLVLILKTSRIRGTMSVGSEAATLVVLGGVVYAIARGNNWARVVLAFLYVTGIILIIFFAMGNPRLGEFASSLGDVTTLGLVLLVLNGAGLACLFLPSAAPWYHGPARSSPTRA